MVNKLLVEVKKHGASFEAHILDLEDENGSYLKVAYKNQLTPGEIVSAADVKLPSKFHSTSFLEGQLVEVFTARIEAQDYGLGWWPAFVHQTSPANKTCFVRYENSNVSETVPWDKIRWLNSLPPIEDLCKFIIRVPEKYKHLASQPHVQENFQSRIDVPYCMYVSGLNAFKVICFLRSRTKLSVQEHIREHLTNLCNEIETDPNPRPSCSDTDNVLESDQTEAQSTQSYKEVFTIPKHLIGLALGHKGTNIKLVQSLNGITKAHYNKYNHIFLIRGESKRLVKIARNLLEYTERKIQVPEAYAIMLQRDEGKLLQKVIHESGLVRVEIEDGENKPKSAEITLVLIGIKDSVSDAQHRIKNELACLKKIVHNMQTFVESQTSKKSPFSKSVKVSEKLVGLAVGKSGANIQKAKNIPGIDKIEEEDFGGYTKFTVFGQTEEAVNMAIQMLELVKDTSYRVDRTKAGMIIGRNGSNVKKIISQSGVLRIYVDDEEKESLDGKVPVKLIGTPAEIEKAKECMDDLVRGL